MTQRNKRMKVKAIASIAALASALVCCAAYAAPNLEAREYKAADGKVFRYRWAEKLPGDNSKVPLVVFMHGAGERGTDNAAQLRHGVTELVNWLDAHEKGFRLVAGQVPEGKRWVEVDWSATSHTMPSEPSETMALQLEFIDKLLADPRTDRSRVYVTGISMGGYGTWDILCRRPDVFAAGIPICGGADVAQAPRIAGLPIWTFHGSADSAVPVCRSRNMVSALRAAGSNVHYREYPGAGHNVWTRTYRDGEVLAWFFRQRKPAQAAPQLYMAGDSIMRVYPSGEWPQYGWGQALEKFMKDPRRLHNFSRSGWSARRFRESGRWEKCIASALKPGDWVIVSFGHNDMNKRRNKHPKNDYSTTEEYKAFLRGFAADAKVKGANIAFATSIAHSDGFSCGALGTTRPAAGAALVVDGGAKGLGPYVNAMREVAAELNAPLLDLNRYAEENLPKLGMEKAKALYMFVKPGEYANYPKGKQDAAHVRDSGAYFYAKAAVEMARRQGLPLADFWKDPANVPFIPSVMRK